MKKNGLMTLQLLIFSGLMTVTSPATTSCRYISDLSNDEIWSFYSYSQFQVYFTLTVGAFSILLLAVAATTWIYIPNFATPSDIMLVIVVATLIDNLSLYIETIYYRANLGQNQPDNFMNACRSLGFFNMLGNAVALYYNTFFCVSLAYSINNTLKRPFLDNLQMHIFCLLATISAVIIIIFTQNSGSPLSGICIYRLANQSSLGLFFLHVLVLSICLYSMKKFIAKIPKNSYFESKSHFKYYNSYLIFFCLCQGANTILYLIGNISCESQSDNFYGLIDNLYAAANVIAVLQGFGIALLRLSHPRFIDKLRQILGKKQRNAIVIQAQQEEQSQWIESLVDSVKGSQILSFIEAIIMSFIEHSSKHSQQLTPYHFQREYSFLIDQVIAEDYIRRRITNRESHFNRQNLAGLKTLKYQVTIYTPEYYSWLFRSQNANLFKSFDIRKNLSLVKKKSYAEGGRSGQFFFATYDHQFIFKTIKSQSSSICIHRAQQFYQYYLKNADTLLVNILGLYRFTRRDIKDEPVYLILMKNLTLSEKALNKRVYDIKGSEFNRSTLKQRKIKTDDDELLKKFTLKDKDFLAIEGRIDISKEKAISLKNILIRDITFLASLGVMDYSLLIIKRSGDATRQEGEYQSTKQPGVYFNIGIIDYLQEWTLRRKAERIFKTLITSQQVTSVSPLNYSKRLIQFIHQII